MVIVSDGETKGSSDLVNDVTERLDKRRLATFAATTAFAARLVLVRNVDTWPGGCKAPPGGEFPLWHLAMRANERGREAVGAERIKRSTQVGGDCDAVARCYDDHAHGRSHDIVDMDS